MFLRKEKKAQKILHTLTFFRQGTCSWPPNTPIQEKSYSISWNTRKSIKKNFIRLDHCVMLLLKFKPRLHSLFIWCTPVSVLTIETKLLVSLWPFNLEFKMQTHKYTWIYKCKIPTIIAAWSSQHATAMFFTFNLLQKVKYLMWHVSLYALTLKLAHLLFSW